MKKKEINRLCRLYRNEDPHTKYVARLARTLFDAAAPVFGLEAGDRDVLETAARLHDIGFALNPPQHEVMSAEIILREGIGEWEESRVRRVAAVAASHRGTPEAASSMLADLAPELEDPGVRRLAAILRVADGLDHGHIQDAKIRAMSFREDAVRLDVKTRWYRANADCAQRKADLWDEVFPLPLRVCGGEGKQKTSNFKGVLRGKDDALPAARKLLCALYDLMRDNTPGMLEGKDPEYLHDYRVSARRFRMVLRLFRGPLKTTAASRVERGIREACNQLSEARDQHVWVQMLESDEFTSAAAGDPEYPPYLDRQRARRDELEKKLPEILETEWYAELVEDLVRLTRVEIPERIREDKPRSAAGIMSKKIRKLNGEIAATETGPLRDAPEALHHLRKRVRRLRYFAEFAAPVFGGGMKDLADRLDDLATALGDIHDCDVHLEALTKDEHRPARLCELLGRKREEAWARFEELWAAYTSEEHQKNLHGMT
ncbi:CHAD domain-containing protein [Kiritimatiella glycovorans]|uniref:CHAD domain-containing protein n=1 Tax=Kiritimatiella glycovorans TaxID=1307763 RepID=A0A0G3EHZ5_9BACT|nr:CHAD domain-containing protein [Kiritimatiella glycovorans]AKJ65052.1 hypothetical protein L21SP4_01815 [Kiritimatiella glycovorans]